MFKIQQRATSYPIIIVLAVVFSVGLALGALSLFYVPERLFNEARESFDAVNTVTGSFKMQFKNNFVMEFCWIAVIWLLGRFNMTAPLVAAVMSLRGFAVGFSVAFVLKSANEAFGVVMSNIMPQCVVALPVMSIFAVMCIQNSLRRRQSENTDAKYLLTGVAFVFVTVLVSAIEVLLTRVLVKI